MTSLQELRAAHKLACAKASHALAAADAAQDRDTSAAELQRLSEAIDAAVEEADGLEAQIDREEAKGRARARFVPSAIGAGAIQVRVDEPDRYTREGRSFFHDLYQAQLKGDPSAKERIESHHRLEVERRAVTSATLGGIIPPAYLVDMYAKASRNGRVYADQVNHQTLPDVGMSLIVPRLTQGTAAGIQATENVAIATQDPTETDLTVNVRTIAGYSPVSRQSLERAAYSDQILFEDLIARYWQTLDSQCISGAGTSGTILGVLQTSGIATSTAATATVAGVYPKIGDLLSQISSAIGGLGYRPDKVVMHPRRWAWFAAALDSSNRPLVVPESGQGVAFNALATGQASGYGGPVGRIMGIDVYTDANVPTNLGTNTNEDRIIVFASPAVHLWERANDPVTVSFEQQAGTSLQVQLVVFGYCAFTAGRFPLASGVISGSGLVPPTW